MSMLPPLLGIYYIEVRDFIFYPHDRNPEVRKHKDDRISATVIDLMRTPYFVIPERVLVYTCDNSDRIIRGRCRQKLFDKWYEEMVDFLLRHELEVDVETDHGIETTHGGVVVRRDFSHPQILQTQLLEQAQGIILEKFGQ